MLWQLIVKDLKMFAADKKVLIISFAVPIAIASFMALIFGNTSKPATEAKLPLLVVDNDSSEQTKSVVASLQKAPSLVVSVVDEAKARDDVQQGKAATALILPEGFGDKFKESMAGGKRPKLSVLSDPTQQIQTQAIRGAMMQPLMSGLFGGGKEVKPPFDIQSETVKQGDGTPEWASVAHVFAGMAVQGVLFFAIEAAMSMMRERRMGIWKRLRAAPVSLSMLLMGRALSSAIRALMILAGVFLFGVALFHFRVNGSYLGLVGIALAAAVMAGTFGLFIASLGRTEQQSRGLSVMVVLSMSMLGGAWFPSFLMPAWVQKVALVIPVKWAVDGFDGATWRGATLATCLPSIGVLLLFAAVFLAVSLARFRWDSEGA